MMEKMAEPLPNSAAHRCEQSKHCGLPVETSSKTQEVNINSRHNVAHLSAGVSSQVEEHEPKGAGKVDIKCLDKDGIKEVSHDKQKEGAEEEIVIEQPLFTIKEVFVYRVPPLRASSGHRAEEWGLANPVFTGVMKIVQVGNSCCLRLFRPPPEGALGVSPELFAQCEVRLDNGRTLQVYVEPVIDSSRYFVLRCEDKASGRHAYVGIGFRERSSAFDMKAVLDDFVRFMDRQKQAAKNAAVEREASLDTASEAGATVAPMKDLSIAEGQKLHIDLKVAASDGSTRAHRRSRNSGDGSKPSSGGGAKVGLLAPPPLPGVTYKAAGVPSKAVAVPPPAILLPNAQPQPQEEIDAVATSPGRVDTDGTREAEIPSTNESVSVDSMTTTGAGGAGERSKGEYAQDAPGREAHNDGIGDDDDVWGEFESA